MGGISGSRLAVFLLAAAPLAGQASFAWKDEGDGKLVLREHSAPALVYNYGPQWKQGAPEDKRRCCYIFPLYTPAGVSMLDDFPEDHWHHRGLFWAWPVVETAGKVYDLWMNMTVKDRSARAPSVSADAKAAGLRVDNLWQADGRDIVREDVHLTVFPSKDGAREMEVELAWQAIGAPVTLRGSREAAKSYGGFSARFAPREGTVLRADGETLTKDEDLTPRRWAELEGVYGGKRAVLRITPDPKDQGAPYQWCLRAYGFAGASFPGKTAADGYTLAPGKPLMLRFRVRVADSP
jgi:Methane oxygenase PmoA